MLRQVRADYVAALSLALVIAAGAFAGAAGPRWAESAASAAAMDTLERYGSDLTYRHTINVLEIDPDDIANNPVTEEPILNSVFPTVRWTASYEEGLIIDDTDYRLALQIQGQLEEVVEITDGAMPSSEVDRAFYGTLDPGGTFDEADTIYPIVEVVVSEDVAETFRLQVGHDYVIRPDENRFLVELQQPVFIRVTGKFRPLDAEWPGWAAENANAVSPRTEITDLGAHIYHGAVLARTDALSDLVPRPNLGPTDPPINEYGLNVEIIRRSMPSKAAARELTEIRDALRRLETKLPGWQTQLSEELTPYLNRYAAGKRVSAFGAVSVAALWAILFALALRILADRRMRALSITRTRGATATTTVRHLMLEAALIAVPAAAIGTAIGVASEPDPALTVSYLSPVGIAVATVVALPSVGVVLTRRAAPQHGDRPALHRWRRRAIEAGLVVTGIVMLAVAASRTADGSTVDPIVSLVPVLVAVAAGVVILRTVPLAIYVVQRLTSSRRGPTIYLATAWAGRTRTAMLPTIAVLVAVGVAALSAAINNSAEHARDAATWKRTPADVVVVSSTDPLDPAVADNLGAERVAAAYPVTSEVVRNGEVIHYLRVVAVDLSAWREITSEAPVQPEPVAALSDTTDAPPAVVVGSFRAHQTMYVGNQIVIGDVRVQIADVVPVFVGVIESPTVLVAAESVPGQYDTSAALALFISGDFGSAAKADFEAAFPEANVYTRADDAAEISASPLLAATLEIHRVELTAAVALAALAAAVSLLVSGRNREFSLSILYTLGFSRRQALGLIATEMLSFIVVAAVAGVATGNLVTSLTADALDLAALTTTLGFSVPTVLDVFTTTLVAAGVTAACGLAIAITVLANRSARPGSALTFGE